MTSQHYLDETDKKIIMDMLKRYGISCDAPEYYTDADGGQHDGCGNPLYHRNVIINISAYDDETDRIEMYIQVD